MPEVMMPMYLGNSRKQPSSYSKPRAPLVPQIVSKRLGVGMECCHILLLLVSPSNTSKYVLKSLGDILSLGLLVMW